MYSCLKFVIEISMLEEKSLMVLIVLGNTIKKSTFKSEVLILGVCIARQLNMEAVEPLSGFEVGDNNMFPAPTHLPPNQILAAKMKFP
jgi:hypothetical protein